MKRIDSFQPPIRKPVRRPVQATAQTAPKATGARFTKLTSTRRRRIAWGLIATILASPVLFGLALVGAVGIGVVVVYGAMAQVLRVPSHNTLLLALLALVYMVGAWLAANQELAQAIAVLAYILLIVGAISLAREVKSARRVWFKKH